MIKYIVPHICGDGQKTQAEINAVFEHKSKWIMQCNCLPRRSGRSVVDGVAARRDLVNLRHEKEGGATGHASKANAT